MPLENRLHNLHCKPLLTVCQLQKLPWNIDSANFQSNHEATQQ